MPEIESWLDQLAWTLKRSIPSLIADRVIKSLSWGSLKSALACEAGELFLDSVGLKNWLAEFIPDYGARFDVASHKKLLEFYTSYCLLRPDRDSVFMDVAGGADGYLNTLNCSRRILQDLRIRGEARKRLGIEVECIEGDAGAIPVPDESVDCISCHHSFEHFQGDSDINFIKEVQRILRNGGRCCIVPIFIGSVYAELTDRISLGFKFDHCSVRVIDPTATLPGGRASGNYARVYDVAAFNRRVVSSLDPRICKLRVLSLILDGALVPDMSLPCHNIVTAINYPYRAMVIEKT